MIFEEKKNVPPPAPEAPQQAARVDTTAPSPKAVEPPKKLEYVGPRPAPLIKFQGDFEGTRADKMTPVQRERYLKENPDSKYWWK